MNYRALFVLGMVAAAAALTALVGGRGSTVTFATHAMPCADLDGDGIVTKIDASIEASYFATSVGQADQDSSGTVQLNDINYVVTQIGTYYLDCQEKAVTWLSGPPGKLAAPGDTDGDGCADVDENGPVPSLGGMRNYLDPYDYFNPGKDGMNRTGDILLIVNQFGQDYPAAGYSINLDRSLVGPEPWRTGLPDRLIRTADISRAVASYGHDC